jgi:hypothetical protein
VVAAGLARQRLAKRRACQGEDERRGEDTGHRCDAASRRITSL